MKLLKRKINLTIIFLLFLSSCTPTVHKAYEGVLLPQNEVAFIVASGGVSICAINEQYFDAAVPGFTLGLFYIELAAPKSYVVRVWNNKSPMTLANTKYLKLDAKGGRVYRADCNNCFGRKLDSARLTEVTDPKEIETFYKRFSTGTLKRQQPE